MELQTARQIIVKQMAEQMGRTPFAVESRLVKMGLLPRPGLRMMAPAAAA